MKDRRSRICSAILWLHCRFIAALLRDEKFVSALPPGRSEFRYRRSFKEPRKGRTTREGGGRGERGGEGNATRARTRFPRTECSERISKFRARRDEVRLARHSRDRQRECNARAIDREGERQRERESEREREREREREGERERGRGRERTRKRREHLVPVNVTELHRSLSKTRVNIFARRFFR